MRYIVFLLASFLLIAGCAQQVSEIPRTADEAFTLPYVARGGKLLQRTITVKATLNDAMKAAEYALVANKFDLRPASWTDERRCGEYLTEKGRRYAWAVWSCFYFQPTTDGMIRTRVFVEQWNSISVKQMGPSLLHLDLTTPFLNKVHSIQGLQSQ